MVLKLCNSHYRWYRVNYTMAGTLVWGRDLGCDFVNTSCRSWLLNQIAKYVIYSIDIRIPCHCCCSDLILTKNTLGVKKVVAKNLKKAWMKKK